MGTKTLNKYWSDITLYNWFLGFTPFLEVKIGDISCIYAAKFSPTLTC